jgi:hypothetical protein
MTDGPTAREIAEAHVVRGRRCSCPTHYPDGFPQPCEEAYQRLSVREQLAVCEMRVGVFRDSDALAGIEGWASSPAPYADADPIRSPLDRDDW